MRQPRALGVVLAMLSALAVVLLPGSSAQAAACAGPVRAGHQQPGGSLLAARAGVRQRGSHPERAAPPVARSVAAQALRGLDAGPVPGHPTAAAVAVQAVAPAQRSGPRRGWDNAPAPASPARCADAARAPPATG